MKKTVIILIFCISILNFSIVKGIKKEIDKIKSEIKWKEEEKPRFGEVKVIVDGKEKMRKVIPGKYEIRVFEISYPGGLFAKNKFYEEFNEVLENIDKDRKYSLLLEERFYNEMKKIRTDELLEEEAFLQLPSSSLEEGQRQELVSLSSGLNITQHAGTDQEYLNRQTYILYRLLKKDGFDEDNVYSELDKEFLIAELKAKRKKVVENFEKSSFEYFVKESYNNIDLNKFQDDSVYTFDKDIVISEDIEDQAILPEIKENIYLTGFPDEIIRKLAVSGLKLKRPVLLLENDLYQGYTYNEENTVIFVNGKIPRYYYDDYRINVIRKKADILELLRMDSGYYVGDFFK